ncbi:hypothetical protein [Algivirga pacifica]|uniref:Uncharacterized protein n=1 Tax=Algivirga pacifica TaxID=1162670 RepID=A0ABP9DH83_9BACT
MFDEKTIAEQFKNQIMTATDENQIAMLIQQAFTFLKMNEAITTEMIGDIVQKVSAALNDIDVAGNEQAERNLAKAKETIESLINS